MAKENIFQEPIRLREHAPVARPRIIGRVIQLDKQDPTTYGQFLDKLPGDDDYRVKNRYGAPYVTLTLDPWAKYNAEKQAQATQVGSLAQALETVIGDVRAGQTGKKKPLKWNITASVDGDTEMLLTHERQYLYNMSGADVLPAGSEYFLHARLQIATVEMSPSTPGDIVATRIDRVQTFLSQVLHGRPSMFEPADFLGK
ncbi:MAG: hypothetical protein WBP26_01900 [Candidatus Saccharimonadales bacterium]